MQTVVILVHLMIVLAMVGLVLIQKSEGGGLGMGGGGGGSGGFLSSRGTSNVLTRTTAILAAMFFATSLFLSILASFDRKPRSILDGGRSSSPSVPSAPGIPGTGGGVLDQLGGGTSQTPAAPPAPSGPQVPRQ